MDLARLSRTVGLTIGVAAGVAGLGAWAALRRPIPQTDGRLRLAGLRDRVTIMRDTWGVPHIYAENDHDLFAALGVTHAQDRLWQMELHRRIAHGRLSEILGAVALDTDRFIRILGFGRVAHREVELLDDESRSLIEAYLLGVNGFLEANRNRLPLEFNLLRHQPEPWTAADVLVWPKMMALNLCGNWTSELFNARILAALGPERYAQLRPRYPDDGLTTVPHEWLFPPELGSHAMRMAQHASQFTGSTNAPQGSNAWVLHGQRSRNGAPLLANDPHLNIAMPAIWYQAHLVGGSFAVAGATIPGTLGVVIGHNEQIAWGVTNSMTDVQDLYIERIHPDDPLRYEDRGEWRPVEVVHEEIVVKGAASVRETVRITHHGPIIDEIAAAPTSLLHPAAEGWGMMKGALALRWTALRPDPRLSRAVLGLNRATNWSEFRTALRDWSAPAQNVVYADVAGNIGYALAGDQPIRARGDGSLPVPGWDGEHEWIGFISHDELPAAFNPPDGLIVSANQRISDRHYRHYHALRGEWLNPYRAARIHELLAAQPLHDGESFAQIQSDLRSLPGLQIARLLETITPDDEIEAAALKVMADWDGYLTADSVAAAIYDSMRFYLERQSYAELGDLLDASTGVGAFAGLPATSYLLRTMPLILARITAAEGPELRDPWLGEGCTWQQIIRESFALAVDELELQFGPNLEQWQYGRVHQMTLRHALGGVAALTPIFNRGPWPTGGDADTVAQAYQPRETAAGPSYTAASYRQIFDLSDWDLSQAIITGGQSGHPADAHYADLHAEWLQGRHRPLLWSRAKVEAATAATLKLEPLVRKG